MLRYIAIYHMYNTYIAISNISMFLSGVLYCTYCSNDISIYCNIVTSDVYHENFSYHIS